MDDEARLVRIHTAPARPAPLGAVPAWKIGAQCREHDERCTDVRYVLFFFVLSLFHLRMDAESVRNPSGRL